MERLTVLIEHGEGEGAKRAWFQLMDNRLHIPTVQEYFRLRGVDVNGVVLSVDANGFSISTFAPGSVLRVSGEDTAGKRLQPTRSGAV